MRAATGTSTRGSTMAARPTTRTGTTTDTGRGGAEPRHAFIVALIEGRGVQGRGDVGLCALDLVTSECVIAQYSDTQTYTRTLQLLNLLGTQEIVIANTTAEHTNKTKLVKLLETAFSEDAISVVARKYFSDLAGLHMLRLLCVADLLPSMELQLSQQFYALAAAAALLRYVEAVHKITFVNRSLRFRLHKLDGTMMIDCNSARNLELIVNGVNAANRKHSLFGVLNSCGTLMGARLLRSNLLQPFADTATIGARQDAVAAILRSHDTLFALQAALRGVPDLDHLVSQLIQVPPGGGDAGATVRAAERHVTTVVHVRRALVAASALREALADVADPLLDAVRRILTDPRLDAIIDLIDKLVNDDAAMEQPALQGRHARCFAIKDGVNALLDIARRTYTEAVKDIHDLVAACAETYTDLSISAKLTAATGFVIHVENAGGRHAVLPAEFINVTPRRGHIVCSTMDLIKLNERVTQSLDEIMLRSTAVVQELLECLRDDVSLFYKLSESIALLDLVVCLAHNAALHDYVRPEFGDALCIQAGRHPVRHVIDVQRPFVPNDTFCDLSCNFQIITGPNMSGKSTYLRQVALLHVMAHIGSYVPAKFARFRLTDRLFTRLSADDSMEANASTFYLEMLEMAACVQHLTPASLVIVDELGRGTAPQDGVGLGFAISEQLLLSRAFTLFATHFAALEALQAYPNVVAFQLQVGGDAGDAYLFSVAAGWSRRDRYGLQLAQVVGFPERVLRAAREVAERVAAERHIAGRNDRHTAAGADARARLQLCQSLCHLFALWHAPTAAAAASAAPVADFADLLRELRARALSLHVRPP